VPRHGPITDCRQARPVQQMNPADTETELENPAIQP